MSQSTQDPLVGTLFDRRYLINKLVARGGMGNIYQAHDTRRGHIVAVKLLRSEFSGDQTMVKRFLREASTVQSLHHANICQLYDIGQTDRGDHYFTMEFLEGIALDKLLESSHVLPPETAIRYIIQAARGLQEAHEHGIVHRDMKPGNIFIVQTPGAPEFVKILDFGVAKTPEGEMNSWDPKLTSVGSTVGTPFYMSPEQIRGQSDVDGRTDIYALGIILWECVFGMPPFVGNSLLEVFDQAIKLKLPKLAPKYKAIPSYVKLYPVMVKALEKDPKKRYQSLPDFIRALQKCIPQLGMGGESVKETAYIDAYAQDENTVANAFKSYLCKVASFVTHRSPLQLVLGSLGICVLLFGIIFLVVFLTPADVEMQPKTYNNYKFISDIPCEVKIDGKTVAQSPSSTVLSEAPPFEIEFSSASAKKTYKFIVTSTSKDVNGYAVNLSPRQSESPTMTVESTPSGANVFVNGRDTGETTPYKLNVFMMKNIVVTLRLDGYQSEQIHVEPRDGDILIKTNLLKEYQALEANKDSDDD